MNVRLWPDEDKALVLRTAGWPRRKFIRFVLERMRAQEAYYVRGSRFFLIPHFRPPLNSFVVSPAGFIYLPREWLANPGELKRLLVPTITTNLQAQSKDLAKAQKYIPAWLAITMATDGEHAQRVKAFAEFAQLRAESMAFTEEAAFSA